MNSILKQRNSWADTCLYWKNKWPVFTNLYDDNDYALNIYTFIEALSSVMTNNHIVITDAGSPSYALPQNLKCKEDQRFIFSASQADMGFSVPGAVGVSKSNPKKHIIVVTGDGSFNSNLQELSVIKHHNLPISIFVLDNNGYLSIKNTQKKFFDNRVYGVSPQTGVRLVDLYKTASLFNLEFDTLSLKNNLNEKIHTLINNPLPKIIKVLCQDDQEIIPTQMFKQVNGNKIQPGLDDMYPFMDEKEYQEELYKIYENTSIR